MSTSTGIWNRGTNLDYWWKNMEQQNDYMEMEKLNQ